MQKSQLFFCRRVLQGPPTNTATPFSRALEPAVGSDMWPRPERKGGRGPANRPLAGDGASQAAKRRRKDAPTIIYAALQALGHGRVLVTYGSNLSGNAGFLREAQLIADG